MNYDWDSGKNLVLEKKGRPTFEKVVEAISNGQLLADTENYKYLGQRMFLISINNYPHLVPYEYRDENTIHLITVYPSRKMKRFFYEKQKK